MSTTQTMSAGLLSLVSPAVGEIDTESSVLPERGRVVELRTRGWVVPCATATGAGAAEATPLADGRGILVVKRAFSCSG